MLAAGAADVEGAEAPAALSVQGGNPSTDTASSTTSSDIDSSGHSASSTVSNPASVVEPEETEEEHGITGQQRPLRAPSLSEIVRRRSSTLRDAGIQNPCTPPPKIRELRAITDIG